MLLTLLFRANCRILYFCETRVHYTGCAKSYITHLKINHVKTNKDRNVWLIVNERRSFGVYIFQMFNIIDQA